MRRGALIAVAVAVVAVAAVAAGRGIAPVGGTEVLFRDEFTGARLDTTKWRTCHWWSNSGCTIASNDELEWYLPGQVSVSGGQARLTAVRRTVRTREGTFPYVSGMISTGPGPERRPRFAFRYGRAEMRARIPEGRGLWPAFWMLAADRDSKPEIDVVEIYGRDPGTVRMRLHEVRGADGTSERQGEEWRGLTPGWHRFAIDWRPGRLTWYVDGIERWSVRGSEVPDEPMYLIANLAVGGGNAGSPDASTPMPATFAIDWIRVTR